MIRAEEWISSTPKHVLLYQFFGWKAPRFWHMPLLRNQDKSKISKRKNPVSLVYYRQAGFLPQAMLNFLGLMGGGMPADINNATEKFTLAEMIEHFDVKNIRPAGPVFDLTKLKWLNGEYLRAMTPEGFYAALRETVLADEYLSEIAALVQTRIETLGEFGNLTNFFFADNTMPAEEVFLPKKRTLEETLAFAAEQLTVLEATEWNAAALEPALKQLGEAKELVGEGKLHAAAGDFDRQPDEPAAAREHDRLRQGAHAGPAPAVYGCAEEGSEEVGTGHPAVRGQGRLGDARCCSSEKSDCGFVSAVADHGGMDCARAAAVAAAFVVGIAGAASGAGFH